MQKDVHPIEAILLLNFQATNNEFLHVITDLYFLGELNFGANNHFIDVD
jgi:hypothetical protein